MVHILGCRQAVRHQTLTLAFVGSNPAIPAKYDPLAQPVEQLPFKQWVRGSSPRRVTKKSSTPSGVDDFLMGCRGLERPALRSRTKNSPGDCFSGRGRVPVGPNASRRDVGGPTALRRVTRKTSKPTAWRFFSYIRLSASSIASQCYWLAPVLLPAGSVGRI